MPVQASSCSRLVLVGWSAAGWRMINPLVDGGLMPNLRGLMERGVMGDMGAMQPQVSPMLWTSAATGVRPDRHGILGAMEPDPIAGGIRRSTSTSRRAKSIWNILHHAGRRSVVVNWPATHPCEPIHGAMVSDWYPQAGHPFGADWRLAAGAIHPAERSAELAELRLHPRELTGDDLAPFLPRLNDIDQDGDRRPAKLAAILAETISVHAAATRLLETQEWDFAAIFHDALAQAAGEFLPFHAPGVAASGEDERELYREVMNGLCCFQDLLLGRILHLAGPEATVMVVSERGLHTGGARTGEAPMLVPAVNGICSLAGPGIRHDELIYGVELVDIAPTLLALFGLPAGQDMAGKVLAEALDEPWDVATIPSWEDVPGDFGRHVVEDDAAADTARILAELAELGYEQDGETPDGQAARATRADCDFNLSLVHLADGNRAAALPLLEAAARERPNETAPCLYLAQCYYELGRLEDCRSRLEMFSRLGGSHSAAELIQAELAIAEGRHEDALAILLKAEESPHDSPGVRHLIGRVYLAQNRLADAERVFRKSLAEHAADSSTWTALAETLLARGEITGAADAALDAIRVKFGSPAAHYTLGCALAKLGRISRAIQAFETCAALQPASPAPHRWLAEIHRTATKDEARAAYHRAMAEERTGAG